MWINFLSKFNILPQSTSVFSYVFCHDLFIKKNDFIRIRNDDSIYQVCEFKPIKTFEDDQITDYEIICRQYYPYNKLTQLLTVLFYKKEYLQSDAFKTVLMKNVDSVCSMLSESEYLNIRYSDFKEDDVYICRWKCYDGKLFPIDHSFYDSEYLNEIMYINKFKCFKYFPSSLQTEIEHYNMADVDMLQVDQEKSSSDSGENMSDKEVLKNFNSSYNSQIPPAHPALIWTCNWENCEQTCPNYIALCDHVKINHVKELTVGRGRKPKMHFRCNWRNCTHPESEESFFKSSGSLLAHLREIHCRKAYIDRKNPSESLNLPKRIGQDYSMYQLPNPLSNPLILLRTFSLKPGDPYIDSLLISIKHKDEEIAQLKENNEQLKKEIQQLEEICSMNDISKKNTCALEIYPTDSGTPENKNNTTSPILSDSYHSLKELPTVLITVSKPEL